MLILRIGEFRRLICARTNASSPAIPSQVTSRVLSGYRNNFPVPSSNEFFLAGEGTVGVKCHAQERSVSIGAPVLAKARTRIKH